jgi:hypothetical protein
VARRLVARLLLAFALAFTQFGGIAHAVSHIGPESDSKHFPGDDSKHCSICQAFSAASSVAPPASPQTTLLDTEHVLSQGDAWSVVAFAPPRPSARDPPRHPDH